MNEPTTYRPTPLPQIPVGASVVYDQSGTPVYLPPQQSAPIVIQMPAPASAPIPAWIRNALLCAVGLVIVCTPATVLLVVAAPALEATGQAVAWSGIGIAAGVIGIAAAIKSLRETPKPVSKSKSER